VGDLGRDAATTARLHADIQRFNLADRVLVTGAIAAERLEALYIRSDIFVLASLFEGYGMAFAEAIAHGLPVIGTTAGAIAETAPAGASLLTPPGDIPALSFALRRLIEDSTQRQKLAAGARAAAAALPTWDEAAEAFSRALETVE
jgi:glycosyltransferase involved in cell wall biosynthesis